MSLEWRDEALADTSMVLVLWLSVPCMWKSLVVPEAGCSFPLGPPALPCKGLGLRGPRGATFLHQWAKAA